MAKVMLLQAAIHDEHVERTQPLGLMYLASYLREHSEHEPVIYDMRPEYKRFDLVEQALIRHRPALVGISAQSPEAPVMHRLAALVKKFDPSVPVVVGGVHVTAYAEETMQADPAIDVAVPGEGEITFHELTRTLLDGGDARQVAGVVCRDGDALVRTPERPVAADPDVIPYPAWDLIDLDVYGRFPRIGLIYVHPRYMMIETARSCPFNCAWCHRIGDRVHRMHSPQYVIGEFERLACEQRVGEVMLIDDMFNFDAGRVMAIFEGLLRKGIRLPIAMVNGIRADMLPDDMLALMRRAGVYRLTFAIETASERMQKLARKNLDLGKARQALETARRLGFFIHGNFIIGLPDETEAEVEQTLDFAARSPIHTMGIYRATPYKNCDLYDIAVKQGIKLPTGEATFSFWDPNINLSRVPLDKLNRAKKMAYWRVYLRPGRMIRMLWHMPNKRRRLPFLFLFFLRKAFRNN